MGDGTLALFPKSPKDGAIAAIEMQEAAAEFSFNNKTIRIGAGINSGIPQTLGLI